MFTDLLFYALFGHNTKLELVFDNYLRCPVPLRTRHAKLKLFCAFIPEGMRTARLRTILPHSVDMQLVYNS